MISEREDLTAIPHAKCTCGHTDDMHYANSDEVARIEGQRGTQSTNYGFGCKMSVHDHDERGWVNASKPCTCRKWSPA